MMTTSWVQPRWQRIDLWEQNDVWTISVIFTLLPVKKWISRIDQTIRMSLKSTCRDGRERLTTPPPPSRSLLVQSSWGMKFSGYASSLSRRPTSQNQKRRKIWQRNHCRSSDQLSRWKLLLPSFCRHVCLSGCCWAARASQCPFRYWLGSDGQHKAPRRIWSRCELGATIS